MMERKAWMQGSSTGWKVALLVAIGGLSFANFGWRPDDATAQQIQLRGRFQIGGVANQPDSESTDGVFLPQDRDATRQLERAKQLLEEDRYSDAATLLDDILKRGEDYFFKPEDSKQVHRSLKMEAQRLIGKMPPEGLKAYELLFGSRAEQMLGEAATEGDTAKLESVARRFFHTPAGYQATLLLGRRYLDYSQPLAAAFCFQRLLDTPHAASQFEPGLSVLTALSWQRGGMTDRAGEVLVALRKQNPKATVRLGPTKIPAFPDSKTAVTWLQSTLGNPTRVKSSDLEQWAMNRGNPSRNSIGSGGIPLLNPRWRVSTTNHPTLEKTLVEARKRFAEDGIPSLPVMQPLAIGNLVLMRTPREVLAVDFVTGKRLWPIRTSDSAWGTRTNSETPMLGVQGVESQHNSWLTDRFWSDATQGTMSSDGTRLFLIQDSVDRADRRNNADNRFGGQFELAKPYNRLTACELQTQGKLKWQVGGPLGEDEPQLAGAFFLGPPLPLQGKVYALAEINGEIKLCVLDAETGRLEWSQQLAVVEQSIMQDSVRMLAGCTPSFADGVLVCPTTAGAVVAVDTTNRSLLWAFQYPRSPQHVMRANFFGVPQGGNGNNERWSDSAVIIADGRVIVSPLESDDLQCLSLVDGKPLWKTARSENLFIGGVQGGKVILVGKRGVNALRLADGKPAWKKPIELPDAALPSGRGYLSGNEYYLPLTTAEVVRIDLPSEKISFRAKSRTGSIPGNLVCFRGEVISQGVDYLESFFQLEPLEKRIAEALAKDPDNAWALAHRSEIALSGRELTPAQLEQAVTDIRRAYSTEPSPFTRDLLVEAFTTALAQDFGKYQSLAAELEPLVRFDQERSKYLRVIAAGLHGQGKTSDALDAYLRLAELQLPLDGELDDVEPKRKVRRDRWIRANVNELITAASAEERAKIDAVINARLELAAAERGPKLLRSFLSYFADHPTADRARELLVEQTSGPTVLLEREQLLRRLEQSTDAARRKDAAIRLAALLRDAGQEQAALSYYRRLEKEFGSAPLIDGKSVKAMLDALPAESLLRRAATRPAGLPAGEVLVERGNSRAARNTSYGPAFLPIEFRGPRGPFFDDLAVGYQPNGDLVGRDGWGTDRFRLALNEGQRGYGAVVVNSACVAGDGHLLVLCTGNQVMGIDTLRSADGSTSRILWRENIGDVNAGNQYFDNGGRARISIRGRNSGRGSPISCLGPVNASGVVVQRGREVSALDPLTGKPLWTRQVDAINCDIFGDEEIVIVAPPAGGDSKVLVLRASDGNLLGTCTLPPANLRWMAFGRHLLVQAQTGDGKLQLKLIDPWGNRDVWSQTFSADVKSTVVDDDTIAIMQRDGRFVMISLADGRITVDEKLTAERNLENIYVIRSAEQDVLVVSRPADARHSSRPRRTVQQHLDGVSPIVTGRVYAFDRATGKSQWAVPGGVEEHGLILSQPSELPVLIFMRTLIEVDSSGSQNQRGSILCIDKRTGRPIYEDDNLPQNVGTFDVATHFDDKTIALSVHQQSWTLKFTGKPIAPEPPYGAGLFDNPKVDLQSTVEGALQKATEPERGPVHINRDPFAPGPGPKPVNPPK
jgi:outer membrane protein assembly factor BamB/tetratricopeptide (TPR) repeat protein